jgi:hypothetical protein
MHSLPATSSFDNTNLKNAVFWDAAPHPKWRRSSQSSPWKPQILHTYLYFYSLTITQLLLFYMYGNKRFIRASLIQPTPSHHTSQMFSVILSVFLRAISRNTRRFFWFTRICNVLPQISFTESYCTPDVLHLGGGSREDSEVLYVFLV